MKATLRRKLIIDLLKAHEAGTNVADLVREHSISDQSIYRWKSKYGGMDVSEAKRLKELEAQNAKHKKLLTQAGLDKTMLKDVLSKIVVKPAARERLDGYLQEQHRISRRRACRMVPISHKAVRYEPIRSKRDAGLVARLIALGEQYPRYGYLMLHSLLRAEGLEINRKRTYCLYTSLGMQVRTKRRKKLA